MTVEEDELNRRADELYDQYAKPLEDEYSGRYIAVSPTGQVLLGDELYELTREATKTLVVATSSSNLDRELSATGDDQPSYM